MIYSIAEWKLREKLEKENESVPDQKRKPTKKPTMRWITNKGEQRKGKTEKGEKRTEKRRTEKKRVKKGGRKKGKR
ncbi:hypothetical protein MSLAZ_1755 [Methanosarcina lacustris Z-7289]|uniref:Uncharacterized protein n=1 Tax=Methanosarcina lacustris Z-7289 TaxID=1434111 RepID=A0A0E3S456_9EURY|nr:hypothetical protein MSLAZ_1755 [Methanosarcina lacustris Z-7289]